MEQLNGTADTLEALMDQEEGTQYDDIARGFIIYNIRNAAQLDPTPPPSQSPVAITTLRRSLLRGFVGFWAKQHHRRCAENTRIVEGETSSEPPPPSQRGLARDRSAIMMTSL